MLEFGEEQDFKYIVNIKVIGVGGGGNNAVKHMINSEMKGIDFWVANTDSQSLASFSKENRIYLGQNIKKNWSLNDINDGHCPFILHKYDKVVFKSIDFNKEMEVNIEGIEIYLNSENHWAFKFRITKTKRISSFLQ